jgi:hypothetical protein
LLRRQPDGSHRLILASFRSSREAEQFAQLVRQKGYEIAIIPRRVTDTVLLHRIEIGALQNLEEADRAWKIAVANRWLSVAGSALRKGS